MVVTAEELPDQPLASPLASALPPETPIFDKRVFGLAGDGQILEALRRKGRGTAVLVGLETDVCVAQSALGLLREGFRVAAVTDGCGSPTPGHGQGIRRMAAAGVALLGMKGLFYEWLPTVEEVDRFHRERPHMRDRAGFTL